MQGFVGVLDTPGVMYVWDQCFMQTWRHSVLQNVCLALLELSRHRFMEARNYIEMKEVWQKVLITCSLCCSGAPPATR